MRNAIGIFNEVWAGAGDRSELPDFTAGYDAAYAVDQAPDRRNMNDVLAKATALGVDVNKGGCGLPWSASIAFDNKALVLGSNNVYYVASQSNVNKDPVTPANVPTYWRTLSDVVGVDAIKDDAEWVQLTDSTYGPSGLSQAGLGTYTYEVAQFVGGGLDPAEIRDLEVYCSAGGDDGAWLQVDYRRGGVWYVLYYRQFSSASNYQQVANDVARIPVNPTQTQVVIRIQAFGSVSGSFNLTQAKQRN
jgi:hypothetical protein